MPAAATATLTGFLGPGLDSGPIITRTDSYQSFSPSASDPCSRICVVTWCNRLHLTGTVNARPAVYGLQTWI